MDIIVGVAVVVYGCVVVEMVVSAKVGSCAGFFDGGPEGVALYRVIVEACGVLGFECGLVAEDKDMGFFVFRQLFIKPLLGDSAGFDVLVERHNESIFMGEGIGEFFVAFGPVFGQVESAFKNAVPSGVCGRVAEVVVSACGVDGDASFIDGHHC